MQVNDSIYPVVDDNDFYVTTNAINQTNYPGSDIDGLDVSITFSASTSEFAPLRYIMSSGCYWSTGYSPYAGPYSDGYVHLDTMSAQRIVLVEAQRPPMGEYGGYALYTAIQSGGTAYPAVRGIDWRGLYGYIRVLWVEKNANNEYANYYEGSYAQFRDNAAADSRVISAAILGITANTPDYRDENSRTPMSAINIKNIETQYWQALNDIPQATRIFGYNYMPLYGFQIVSGRYTSESVEFSQNDCNYLPIFNCGPRYTWTNQCSGDRTNLNDTYGQISFGVDTNYATYDTVKLGSGWITYLYTLDCGLLTKAFVADYILKCAATYGIICFLDFRENLNWYSTSAVQIDTTDINHIYYGDTWTTYAETDEVLIPQRAQSGIFTGEYSTGADDITGTAAEDIATGGLQSAWNGGAPEDLEDIDPNTYTDTIEMTAPALTTQGIFNRTYALTSTEVSAMANYLWNADDDLFDQIITALGLMGEKPIDGIIDLRLYPFDVAALNDVSTPAAITFGRLTSSLTGVPIPTGAVAVIDLGSCLFYPYFKNFLDYAPYTTADLYIPFIGKFPVETAQFMGHTINVKMCVDYTTGACAAVVYCNSIPVIYKQGVIGTSISMTGSDAAAYAQTVVQNVIGAATAATSAGFSAASGNIPAAIGEGVQAANHVFGAAAVPTMYQSAGSSSPSCSLYMPMHPYFTIYQARPYTPADYGHNVGFACEVTTRIGATSGYAVFENVDMTGVSATAAEKAEIKALLESGVYI